MTSDKIVNDAEYHKPLRLHKDIHLHMPEQSGFYLSTFIGPTRRSDLRLHDLDRISRSKGGELCECNEAFQCGYDSFRVVQFASVEDDEGAHL